MGKTMVSCIFSLNQSNHKNHHVFLHRSYLQGAVAQHRPWRAHATYPALACAGATRYLSALRNTQRYNTSSSCDLGRVLTAWKRRGQVECWRWLFRKPEKKAGQSNTCLGDLGGIARDGYTLPDSTIRMRQLSTENGMLLTSEYRDMAQNHELWNWAT